MSSIGTSLATSLVQTAQAQQTASKAKDADRARHQRSQRLSDLVELRVAGVESSEAVRKPLENDSDHPADRRHGDDEPEGAGSAIDLKA